MTSRALVLSPHRDDAAISLGSFLVKTHETIDVLNVFSQSEETLRPEIDRDVNAAREAEDAEVARLCGFRFVDLGFPDTSVRGLPWDDSSLPIDEPLMRSVEAAIKPWIDALGQDDYLYMPAAYGMHPDHYLTLLAFSQSNDAAFHAVRPRCRVYGDQLYYYERAAVHDGLPILESSGTLQQHVFQRAWKQRVLEAYPSQLSTARIEKLVTSITTEDWWTPPEAFFGACALRSSLRVG